MKLLNPGHVLDGFEIKACLHAGGMAHIYTVQYALSEDGTRRESEFPMAMKIPRMTAGDGAENIVSFEVEQQILPAITGAHVPRFVAAGDLSRMPYLVMEYVKATTLETWAEAFRKEAFQTGVHDRAIAKLGAELAHAVHSLHKQNVCHLDLKPANVLIRPNGKVVLLDFGLSSHAHYPDLLAEEMRKAVGSPAWIAPEQVVGVRGDPRSDIFAIGVMLYELATDELPFGEPVTTGGMRQRLWMDPVPPRKHNPNVPEWLQEVILKCLHPEADKRYPSAAHLAMDLSNPEQIRITERGRQLKGTGFNEHLKRWIKAAGMHYQPSALPSKQIKDVPIVMVALPHADVSDATWYSLREAVDRSLGIRPGARLACVTVISHNDTNSTELHKSESSVHRMHLARMQQWTQGLNLQDHQISFHVLEASDVANALVMYAQGNEVSMIIMGAATHGLQMQRFVTTVPIKVAMEAPCTVILVKQDVPFEFLGTLNDE
jgi:serine/threonine protein kinase